MGWQEGGFVVGERRVLGGDKRTKALTLAVRASRAARAASPHITSAANAVWRFHLPTAEFQAKGRGLCRS